jgi:hypothetical protein
LGWGVRVIELLNGCHQDMLDSIMLFGHA